MLLKSVPGIGGIVIWTRRPSPSHRVAAIRALHSPLPLISLSTATMILFTPGGSIRFSMPPADSAAQPGKSNNCIAEAVLSTPSPTISHSLGIGAAIRMAPAFAGPQNHGAREFPDQGVGIEQKWRNNPPHSGTKPICRCPNQPEWRVTTGLAQPQRAFQQWLPRYNGHGGGHSCSRRGTTPGGPTVHPTTTFSAHRRRSAWTPVAGPRTATQCPVHGQLLSRHQLLPSIARYSLSAIARHRR